MSKAKVGMYIAVSTRITVANSLEETSNVLEAGPNGIPEQMKMRQP